MGGDWVCADCGYIYDKNIFGGRYFEEQTFGFKCPQCSGPRRRYAKMVGNTVGVTLDGGDGPILFWSGFGFILTIVFGVWAPTTSRAYDTCFVRTASRRYGCVVDRNGRRSLCRGAHRHHGISVYEAPSFVPRVLEARI